MARHMFPGGNTPEGFFSYFDNILPFSEAKKVIYLKGGSGTGKSTFMKKIGDLFEKEGNAVEYMHCSNDANSLDGVCIRNLKICVLDATFPHVGDPTAPVAIDEILNVADFIDESNIVKYQDELRSLITDKKQFFDKSTNYLKAAHIVYCNNSYIYNKALSKQRLNDKTFELLEMIKFKKSKIGKNRKLFATAITPYGLINFIDMIVDVENVYVLYGEDGMGTDILLSDILRTANMYGYDTETYYCPLKPEKPEHLIIRELNICFTTSSKYHKNNLIAYGEVHFSDFLDMDFVKQYEDEIAYNYKVFDDLLQKCMDTMRASKKVHDRIEEIYIESMDFKALDKLYEKTIARLTSI